MQIVLLPCHRAHRLRTTPSVGGILDRRSPRAFIASVVMESCVPRRGLSAIARCWSAGPLYAPKAATPPKLDGLVSITASRWLEGGGAIPVVFATDRQGNLYVTRYEGGQWRPWRSFYN
jgi:hypothetical protein